MKVSDINGLRIPLRSLIKLNKKQIPEGKVYARLVKRIFCFSYLASFKFNSLVESPETFTPSNRLHFFSHRTFNLVYGLFIDDPTSKTKYT